MQTIPSEQPFQAQKRNQRQAYCANQVAGISEIKHVLPRNQRYNSPAPFPHGRDTECQYGNQTERTEYTDGQDLLLQDGAVKLEQHDQTEADDKNHAAVG